MRKTLKIIVCVVLVIWVFATGLMLGTYRERKNMQNYMAENTAQQPQVSEAAQLSEAVEIDMVTNVTPATEPSTTYEFTFETTENGGNLTTYESESVKQLEVPSGNSEIAKALVTAVNTTKSLKSFSAVKTEKADFTIDSVTGGNTVKGIAEGIINKIGNKPETSYSFSNGADKNGSDETPNSIIAPANKAAYIDEAAIKSASAQPNSIGGYDITIIMNDESQTISQSASNHNGLFDTLDIDSLSLPSSFKMSKLDFTYSGAQINASINADGRLASIDYSLPISNGVVEGGMLSVNISVVLHGAYTAAIRFTY